MPKIMNMETKHFIFLDIDGVLAGEDFFRNIKHRGFIDPEKVKLLNQLEGAEIVISSSWGYDGGRTEKSLRQCGLTLPIVGYTKHPNIDWVCRGNEIEQWLLENTGRGTKYGGSTHEDWQRVKYDYVIIDDDSDMLLGQAGHFIKVDRITAITQDDIDKAKQILNLNV